jgi:hypothetical protein
MDSYDWPFEPPESFTSDLLALGSSGLAVDENAILWNGYVNTC